ncbi:actin depolymerizing factor [Lactarius indigo]|nr:actin depolymerizing factor [Lactarius indigo]
MAIAEGHPLIAILVRGEPAEMSSGVGVNAGCLESFQELKLGKKLKYIIFTLNKEKTEIIVEKASKAGDYEDFIEDLPALECRWAVYDLEFDTEDGKRNKLVFVSWSPDGAKVKDKMVAASSREALRRSLVGIAVEVQATEFSEVARETVLEKAKKK